MESCHYDTVVIVDFDLAYKLRILLEEWRYAILELFVLNMQILFVLNRIHYAYFHECSCRNSYCLCAVFFPKLAMV